MEPMEDATYLAVNGHNIFITGQDGVGKTYLMTQLHSLLSREGSQAINCVETER